MFYPFGHRLDSPDGLLRLAEILKRFHARYAPWISLALGALVRGFSREEVDFAPKAVAILALAWLVPTGVARWLRPKAVGEEEGRVRRFVRTLSPTVTVLLYKNVLFFLVPIWFGSASLSSANVVFPTILGAMAIFTCFADRYHRLVLDRPRARVLWTAVVLFAVLVPATAVVALTSPRTSIVVSALVASVMAWVALAPREHLRSFRSLVLVARVSLPATFVVGVAAPLFPPVPMVCHDHRAGVAIVGRELVGAAERFPRGTYKVYAWFTVTLPKRDRQQVVMRWYHDGASVGGSFRTSVEGGRKEGFRTWTYHSSPSVGSWRVDLLTERSEQLIGRAKFEVGP